MLQNIFLVTVFEFTEIIILTAFVEHSSTLDLVSTFLLDARICVFIKNLFKKIYVLLDGWPKSTAYRLTLQEILHIHFEIFYSFI